MQKISKTIAKRIVFEGKWIDFYNIDFSVGDKIIKNYEGIARKTKPKNLDYDGVTVIPILKQQQIASELLLIAQYRPPVEKFQLEFPAGLSENDNVFENANRELQEETGFTAESEIKICIQDTPICHGDAPLSAGSGKMVMVSVDLDSEVNKNPKQNLEDSENIKVHRIPLDQNILEAITTLVKQNDYACCAKIYSFAIGFVLSQKLKDQQKL